MSIEDCNGFIFCELIKGDIEGTTGYGISPHIGDNEHLLLVVDLINHEVWFENGPSVEVKVQLAREAGFGGVTFWRLGGEDPEVWERVRKFISTPSAQPSQPSAS